MLRNTEIQSVLGFTQYAYALNDSDDPVFLPGSAGAHHRDANIY